MTTIGKVCLWLTVIGLGVISIWLLPTVGRKHNLISAQLSKSSTDLEKAVNEHGERKQEVSRRQHLLTRLQIGWDKRWVIEQTANSGVVVQGVNLVVRGLGAESGLNVVLDDDGQPVPPAVHAFKTSPDGGMIYVGEFQAAQIAGSECFLEPVWRVTQEEVDDWLRDPELPWRFRTLVPAGKRQQIDQLHEHLQTLTEALAETEANRAQQETLGRQAEKQLEIRRQELLGNPDAKPTPGRAEYTDGLLRTISTLEEDRNELQFEIDILRRRIRKASAKRDELVRRVRARSEQLPSADTNRITRGGAAVQ